MVKNLTISNIIKNAIDLHVHIGPEVIPRKFTVSTLIKKETGRISGMALKNHFYATVPFIEAAKKSDKLLLVGGVVLNNPVGGLNPETIYSNSLITKKPIIVWFPTINAKNFLEKSKFEIAPEWVQRDDFKARKSKDVTSINLDKNVIGTLKVIKNCGAVLATGHISWRESVKLVGKAKTIGIKKIIVTHPIYQKIDMPIEVQIRLANKGCFIEQSYSMYSIDKIPISEIASQIKQVGSRYIILSSDVGQTFSPSPSEALELFANLLDKEGITKKQLYEMLVINPRKLLGI